MAQVRQPDVRNRLLAALSPHDFALLVDDLRPVDLDIMQVLHAADQVVETLYFPETGMVSMIAELDDGHRVEVGLVGSEGLVGLAVILDAESSPIEALVQAGGPALRIQAAGMRAALDRSRTLRTALLRYAQAFHLQVTQTAACNGRHVVEERMARWLLMAHDRTEGDRFPMTQEFLAMMLGVRRAGVSVAAGVLQKAGVIHHARGCITVLDRPGLEAASCDCYAAVRRQFDRLLGAGAVA